MAGPGGERGYLLLVLHAHMPWVCDPTLDRSREEEWLFEALTECYLPLLGRLGALVRDGIDYHLTLSITPCLAAMLEDPLLQHRYLRYLDDHARLAAAEAERVGADPRLRRLAEGYGDHLTWCRAAYEEIGRRPARAFAGLADAGAIELLTSAATHPYLPLWADYPEIVDFQIRVGVASHRRTFGRQPRGFWLPECGYAEGLDRPLHRAGIRYTFVESHGLLNGRPAPRFGILAPVHSPAGVAFFGRDWHAHDLVWLKDRGYPGEAAYLDADRDIGYQLDGRYLEPLIHHRPPVRAGLSYARNRGGDPYDPELARHICDRHAGHFFHRCQEWAVTRGNGLDRPPVMVALFDAEHFGHWWREGPLWLDLVLRKLACDQRTVALVTPRSYLERHPTNQVVDPAASSWGYQGYSETWLVGRNHWIYPRLFHAIESFRHLLSVHRQPAGPVRAALDQYLRELLAAQASDWAFMLHAETAVDYATRRVETHLERMAEIFHRLTTGSPKPRWLDDLARRNNLFSDLDLLAIYQGR